MTDNAAPARRPALIAGAIIGVFVAVVFSWLFALLAGIEVGSGPVIGTLILLAGWALFCTFSFGPTAEHEDEEPVAVH